MLESAIIEIINPSTKSVIAGCIYGHHCMELSKRNSMQKTTP